MRFKNVVFPLLFLFISVTMTAQKVTVTGQVLDSVSGEGVPFAGVFVKGTTMRAASPSMSFRGGQSSLSVQ